MRVKTADSLFFAVRPDSGAAARIASCCAELRAAHGLAGRPVAPEQHHVTLHFLGDFQGIPEEVVTLANRVAHTVHMAPFDIAFDRVLSFNSRKGRYPLVLRSTDPSSGLMALQRHLSELLKEAGLPNWLRGFTPHLTLLYDEHRLAEQPITPVRWTVGEFVLVHSLVGLARHEVLARWPLQAPAG